MKKEMLINCQQSEEIRIAIIENGILEELYVERASQETYVGNIYKGKIVNIEPSIQAAFVDFGVGRNGFLHASDVDPAYYKHLLPKDLLARLEAEENDEAPQPRPRRDDRGPGPARNDRNDRGPRNDRAPRDDRGPRPSRPRDDQPQRPAPQVFTPPVQDSEFDDFGFGAGIDEGFAPPAGYEQPPPLHTSNETDSAPETAFGTFDNVPETGNTSVGFVDYEEVTEVVDLTSSVPPPQFIPVDELIEDDGFGAGIDFEEPRAAVVEPEVMEESLEEEEAKPKARGKRKKKTDEPAKPRRKKKDDGDDAAPAVRGAEHRTEPDGEDEIKPFFEGGPADDFDIAGPNDRFLDGANTQDASGELIPSETENVVFNESTFDPNEEFVPVIPEPRRGRNDRDRNDRGPRNDRGGDRGGDREYRPRDDRGQRDDRGPRDERGQRDDRGTRGGGGRGGPPPRSGPGGPRTGPNNLRPGGGRDRNFPRLPIEQIFKRGQEVIVQVIKEGIGTKGPTLSTFISIAGRYLVLMPSLNRFGVSRKIEDLQARRRLREIMNELSPPPGVGFIVRTAAIDRNKIELQNDLVYLLRLWQVVVRRIKKVQGAVEIYRESDLITRTIRDNFRADIDAIYVDNEAAYTNALEFMQVVMPRYADRIKHHSTTEPLFHKFGVEDELMKINQKRIEMPRGGSIIIEQTEALVAIDVNSGTFRAENNAEETAFQMNMLAAKEIARQLRLRDLGGVIVNDFIDMRDERHRRMVEDNLRNALMRDKARTKILRISQFGIIEMTRQRMQPSLKKRVYNECSHCKGTGYVKTSETMSVEIMRVLQLAAFKAPPVKTVKLTVHMEVAFELLNKKRREIAALEEKAQIEIKITGQTNASPELMEIQCLDANGSEVKLAGSNGPPRIAGGRAPRGN